MTYYIPEHLREQIRAEVLRLQKELPGHKITASNVVQIALTQYFNQLEGK